MSDPQGPDKNGEPKTGPESGAENLSALTGEVLPPESPQTESAAHAEPSAAKPRRPARAASKEAPKSASKRNDGEHKEGAAGADEAEHARRQRHREERHGILWAGAIAFITVAGGVAAALWYWQGAVRVALEQAQAERVQSERKLASDFTTEINNLDQRISKIEERMNTIPDVSVMKDNEAQIAVLGERAEGLGARLGTLEKKVSALEQTASPAAVEEAKRTAEQAAKDVSDLQDQVSALAGGPISRSVATAERRQALVLALGQLREAVASARPFRDELDALSSLGAEDQNVLQTAHALDPYAASGVPALAGLRAQFPKVADDVVRAANLQAGGRWIDTALARFASVVTVRKTGADVQGTTPEAIVARAEAKLDGGDLKGALAEMNGLSGPPADAAKDWLAAAKSRVAADDALAALSRHVIGEIAQSGSAQSGGAAPTGATQPGAPPPGSQK